MKKQFLWPTILAVLAITPLLIMEVTKDVFHMAWYVPAVAVGWAAWEWFKPKGEEKQLDGSPRPDRPATRQWVEEKINAKTSNCMTVGGQSHKDLLNAVGQRHGFETQKLFKGSVTFRGKAIGLLIDKTNLYGYDTTGGGRVDYERRDCNITGEIWINHKHILETREAMHVSEVVSDLQAALNHLGHIEGELLLQVRSHCCRYIEQDDVEKGWPQAAVGNVKIGVASMVQNFVMEEL